MTIGFKVCTVRSVAVAAIVAIMLGGCVSKPIQHQRVAKYRPKVHGVELQPKKSRTKKPREQPSKNPKDKGENGGEEAPSARALQIGDRIRISLKGIRPPEEIQDEIDGEGNVNLTYIGNVMIAGLTTSDAEALIEQTYIKGGYYKNINVIVRSQEFQFFVYGEVNRQGPYPLTRNLTLRQAIVAAGGFTDFAKKRDIQIVRNGKRMSFNYPKIEKGKQKDPTIRAGDIIRVKRTIFM